MLLGWLLGDAELLENLMSFSYCTRTGWQVFLCKPSIQRLMGQADRLLYCSSSASPVDLCLSVTKIFQEQGNPLLLLCQSGRLLFLCNQLNQAAVGL